MEKKQIPDSLESIVKACDEAEDLLAALDESDHQQQEVVQKQSIPIDQSNTSISKTKTIDEEAGGCLTILGIGIASVIIAGLANQNNNTISGSYASQTEYSQAMEMAKNAVLVSEHKQAIQELEEIKRKGVNPATMNNGLLNNKIIQARNKIKFLDQKGESSYKEYGDYGYQWYDEHDSPAYKVFFAYSNKCKRPLITFKYLRGQGGPLIKRHYVTPRSNTSTLRVPYLTNEGDDIWLYVDKFRCN